jgi:sugar phosphate isomerase/epimerase
MEIGYRIIRPEDVGAQPLRFAQISLWRTADWGVADGERAVNETIQIAGTCRQRGIRTVFHPLEYPLTGEHAARTMDVMRRLASAADLGIIIHDEGGAGGQRLSAAEETSFEKNLRVISALTTVSIENAFNSGDITRFWERFVVPAPKTVSITLDIGHLESADIDSIAFVRNMPEHLLDRVYFVHMHHKGAERYGIKDHWPLVSGCREIEALRVLLSRKPDLRVILELETKGEGVRESIELLRTM